MTRSILETDGYKFSMQDAGWPLREETFVYFHRSGGPQIVPFNIGRRVMQLWPEASNEDYEFLAKNEYEMGIGFKSVFSRQRQIELTIRSIPPFSIFYPGEPVFTVTGPSALVSWFEPLVLQLSWQIQLGTLALTDREGLARELQVVTCHKQKEIALEILDAVGIKAPPIAVDDSGYCAKVFLAAEKLLEVVKNPDRIFEVGLRSASCMAQHDIVIQALKEHGIRRTSDVASAKRWGMIPVGTMGHEHTQRYRSDEMAFRAMKDRRPYRSSFLTDTYDPYQSGIPAAVRVMMENPTAHDSMRYDSANKRTEYVFAVALSKEKGLEPGHIIESELDLAETASFEGLRMSLGIAENRQFYGYGKYFVSDTAPGFLTRDRVSAVYKLAQTGPWPTMKFSEHKESIPGRPVAFRRTSAAGAIGIVGQEGEKCPDGYALLTDEADSPEKISTDVGRQLAAAAHADNAHAVPSIATRAVIDQVRRDRERIRNERI